MPLCQFSCVGICRCLNTCPYASFLVCRGYRWMPPLCQVFLCRGTDSGCLCQIYWCRGTDGGIERRKSLRRHSSFKNEIWYYPFQMGSPAPAFRWAWNNHPVTSFSLTSQLPLTFFPDAGFFFFGFKYRFTILPCVGKEMGFPPGFEVLVY